MHHALKSTFKFFLLLSIAAMSQFALAQSGDRASIAGVWQAENGQMKIQIYESGDSATGKLLWGQQAVEADGKTFKRDVKNPNPALRGRSLEGIMILQGLEWNYFYFKFLKSSR